jgi:hypothetical protein
MPATSGCYGLALSGAVIDLAGDLLGHSLGGWPAVEVDWTTPLADPPASGFFGRHQCVLPLLTGGHVVFDREQRIARFHKPGPANGQVMAHPCLSAVGLVFARWDGRVALHAGGVLLDGAVWGVLGAKEAGKSTTLAAFAHAGFGVLCDDLLVLDGTTAFAGPRTVDLRPQSAARLEGRGQMLEVREGQRHRLALAPTPPVVPLGGFFVLDVGNELSIESVTPVDRLGALNPYLTLQHVGLPPSGLLDLVGLPMWRVSRSRDWADLPRLIERLLATAAL